MKDEGLIVRLIIRTDRLGLVGSIQQYFDVVSCW